VEGELDELTRLIDKNRLLGLTDKKVSPINFTYGKSGIFFCVESYGKWAVPNKPDYLLHKVD
jgi:hypothetical protein